MHTTTHARVENTGLSAARIAFLQMRVLVRMHEIAQRQRAPAKDAASMYRLIGRTEYFIFGEGCIDMEGK